MEIEISRRLAGYMLSIMLVIGPLLIGILASPHTEDDRPVLLTPRLARLNEYRRDVRSWVKALQEADAELTTLEEPSDDLFDQNSQINRVYQQSRQLVETIDQTAIPPTFEPLHELLGEAAKAYLDATTLIARWISEPGDENRQAAGVVLSAAHELLNRLYTNPWIEVEP
jgi:hypothetical protein